MSKPYTLLIADHNFHVRKFLRRELSLPEYRILEASNHLQLLSKIYDEKTVPDLIVLDPYIPYISGVALLERLQNITPAIPVILYTYMTEYKDHPITRSVQAFVEKNGDTRELKQTIAAVLQSCKAGWDASTNHHGHRDGSRK